MVKYTLPKKFNKIISLAVLITLVGVSCEPFTGTPPPTPAIHTVEVTRLVTQEVTRIVEVPVPVTVTPTLTPAISLTPSLTSTITQTPTITPTPDPPVVTILQHIACWFGPGDVYLYFYGLLETSWMEVIGRNQEGTWLLIQGVHGWNPCWARTEFVRFNDGGDVTTHSIRIVDPNAILPYAMNLYRPPTGIEAFRTGNKVNIYWNAVWMTEDDYEGYLIEAWLCQEGQQVFKPTGYKPPISQNIGTLGIIIIDEPGCLVPSYARIYTVEKHGYTGYMTIPWPQFNFTPSPTP